MEKQINKLLKQGKHQQQDFCPTIEDQKKIARTLVAFANTDGGSLFIGVKDNGKIVGVNPEEVLNVLGEIIKYACQPKLIFESKIWQEGFRFVLEISIKSSQKRAFKALDDEGNWKAFIRRNDQTILANKIIFKIWSFERKGIQKPLQFDEKETQFLSVFTGDKQFTLSKLYQSLPFPKQQIDYLLALFIYWKVIDMELSSEGFLYQLN